MNRTMSKLGKGKSSVSRGRVVRAGAATRRTSTTSASKASRVQDLIERHFSGSITKFVKEMLAGRQLSAKETNELVTAVDSAS